VDARIKIKKEGESITTLVCGSSKISSKILFLTVAGVRLPPFPLHSNGIIFHISTWLSLAFCNGPPQPQANFYMALKLPPSCPVAFILPVCYFCIVILILISWLDTSIWGSDCQVPCSYPSRRDLFGIISNQIIQYLS
jgi:hypothetical protein